MNDIVNLRFLWQFGQDILLGPSKDEGLGYDLEFLQFLPGLIFV